MNLSVRIEKKEDAIGIEVPLEEDGFQMRSDGILLNGIIYFWEEIEMVTIYNLDTELGNRLGREKI